MFKRKPKFDTSACSSASRPGPSTAPEPPAPAPLPYVKVALLGDTGVGKTSLLVRYTEGEFDEGQMRTQGINFMEQTVSLQDQGITFSIWDIGGHKDFESMLPLVCNEAAALIFVFDLTRPETLESVREWHRKARSFNRTAMPFLVGAKFDHLIEEPVEDHAYICKMARAFAAAMDAPLMFIASSVPINVTNLFKVILIRLFDLAPVVPPLRQPGEPLRIYEPADIAAGEYVEDPPLPPRPANTTPKVGESSADAGAGVGVPPTARAQGGAAAPGKAVPSSGAPPATSDVPDVPV